MKWNGRLAIALAFVAIPGRAEQPPLRFREALGSGKIPLRVVCLGDSVTGIYYHSGGRRAYPELLGELLLERHPGVEISVINAGISGHTSTNGLARLRQDVLVHRPHLVTVAFGLNDVAKGTLELYRKNLAEIVAKCREAGADVVLCTPNAVSETADRPVAKVASFAEVARNVAKRHGIPLCDLHAATADWRKRDPEAWRLAMSDEIHPNFLGHRHLAETLVAAIDGGEVPRFTAAALSDPLAFTRSAAARGAVEILTMPPFDKVAGEAVASSFAGASAQIVTWPVAGLNRYTLMKDASHRVRPIAPDLVLVAVPRSAGAKDREEFIRTQMWIVSNSLSRGKREWDVVVVHPDVFDGPGGEADREYDALIRAIVPAQDLALIDRLEGDTREASVILSEWMARHSASQATASPDSSSRKGRP